MKKQWEYITNYENYKINNYGEIFNTKTNKKIKSFIGNDNYVGYICIRIARKSLFYYID